MRILVVGASGYLGGAVALRLAAGRARCRGARARYRQGRAPDPGRSRHSSGLARRCHGVEARRGRSRRRHQCGRFRSCSRRQRDPRGGRGHGQDLHPHQRHQRHGRSRRRRRRRRRSATRTRPMSRSRSAPHATPSMPRCGARRRAAAARSSICCPLVYGAPAWPGRESVQLPHLVKDARERGVARYVGAGEARWSHCHIDDIAEAYAAGARQGSGRRPLLSGKRRAVLGRAGGAHRPRARMCRLQPGRWTRRLPPGDRVRCGPTAPMPAPAACASARISGWTPHSTISMRTFADWQVNSAER